jgi:hypothetical protein
MGGYIIIAGLFCIGFGLNIMAKPLGTATEWERDLAVLYPIGVALMLLGMGMGVK